MVVGSITYFHALETRQKEPLNTQCIKNSAENGKRSVFKVPSALWFSLTTCGKPRETEKKSNTHSNTAILNWLCKFPKYSPIICLLSPFLVIRKRATPRGEFSRKPREIRYAMPRSGFLLKRFKPTRYWRFRAVSDTCNKNCTFITIGK